VTQHWFFLVIHDATFWFFFSSSWSGIHETTFWVVLSSSSVIHDST